ncbi:uncharacterized protein IWZ02DRAFT_461744 [Phyllosticta citriasiana]|uniref:Uncharacterized protein n=1 Tax=Phyllosticta citriasiana TaxID=595635 RepID=A0ABR1L018_9PEZI
MSAMAATPLAVNTSVAPTTHSATSPTGRLLPHKRPALLPKPFPSATYVVGDLLTDPTNPTAPTLHRPKGALSDRDYDDTRTTAYYKDIATVSPASGNFARSLGGELLVRRPKRADVGFCSIEAERAAVRGFKSNTDAFEKAVFSEGAKQWLLKAAEAHKPVYFVAAVQEVVNAKYSHAHARDAGNGLLEVEKEARSPSDPSEEAVDLTTEAPANKRPMKRRDSAFEKPTHTKTDVLGLELREVRVKLTKEEMPQKKCDLKFEWLNLDLEGQEGMKLAVGLGQPLDQEELVDLWEEDEPQDNESDEEDEE